MPGRIFVSLDFFFVNIFKVEEEAENETGKEAESARYIYMLIDLQLLYHSLYSLYVTVTTSKSITEIMDNVKVTGVKLMRQEVTSDPPPRQTWISNNTSYPLILLLEVSVCTICGCREWHVL